MSALLGRVRDEVEVYASSVFLEEGPAAFHLELLDPLLAQGVTKVKVRVGPEWRRDLDTLASLRALLDPGVELMVDGSEIFTLPTAVELARRLHELGVMWFEEPLPQGDHAGIEALAAASPVPIAYGEHLFGVDEAIDAMRRGQLQVLQPDASTCGGLTEARGMAAAAAGFGVRVVPHVCAGPISLAANLHLAATRAGDPPRRVPAVVGGGVVDVRARLRARPEDDRRRQAGRSRTGRDSASSSMRTRSTATRTVRQGPASPARWAACPIASSAIDDLS